MAWFGSLAPRSAEDDLLDESRMPFGVGMPQEAPPKVSAKAGANVATGLVPGSGIADVLGYLPNYEGGTEPSFGQNIKAGKYGQAALQTLGAAGDVAMGAGAIPLGLGIKEVAAAAKPAKEVAKTAEEARAAFHDFAHSLGETHGGQEGAAHGAAAETGAGAGAHPGGPEVGVAAAPGSSAADVAGGAGGGADRLGAAQARAANTAGAHAALPGLPQKPLEVGGDLYIPGPIGKVRDVAESYMRNMPIKPSYHLPPEKYHKLDEEHSRAIAQAYEDMPHTPDDPAVRNSYEAMAKETRDQYDHIRREHPELVIEHNPEGFDPYAATPRLAARDVGENNHLSFFPTEQGFGTGEQGGIDLSAHPMMQPSGRTLNGRPLLYNDLFRIVHDYFGHLAEGYGFRAAGEDNAWRAHAAMYSDLARPAMTSETRGQNSWVNFGPQAEANKGASGANTIYAPQKLGLMPEWTMRDRGSPDPTTVFRGSAHAHPMVDMSKIGTGQGSRVFGEGMYSAEAKPVGESYQIMEAVNRDPLLKKYKLSPFDADSLGRDLKETNNDHVPVIEGLRDHIENLKAKVAEGDTSAMTAQQIKRSENMIRYLNDPKRAKGHLYEMAIDKPQEQFLHWNKTLSEQSPYVQQRLQPIVDMIMKRADPATIQNRIDQLTEQLRGLPKGGLGVDRSRLATRIVQLKQQQLKGAMDPGTLTGKQLYENAAEASLGRAPKTPTEGYPVSAQYLRSKGLAGVKYLAGQNFGTPKGAEGSHNYVSFYPERILKRYAIPGMLGASAFGSLARRPDDGS